MIGRREHSKAMPDSKRNSSFTLLVDQKAVDPTLSSLFATKPLPPKPRAAVIPVVPQAQDQATTHHELEKETSKTQTNFETHIRSRKRKRNRVEDELEDVYMRRLAREEEKDAEKALQERETKRQQLVQPHDPLDHAADDEDDTEHEDENEDKDEGNEKEEEDKQQQESNIEPEYDASSPPPYHETEQIVDDELVKANCTVFLANVSTTAISSKTAFKKLTNHLTAFLPSISAPEPGEPNHKMQSIRFRSTPYASSLPKRAAFAKKELMDATAKSTNAYVIYSSPLLAREAVKHLNGTVILDRHLRADQVAHPAKVENKRCVFVGNLGFVDDESNIQDANEEDGREKRKRGKEPSDVEEGLWRTFGRCGKVESVRVIRDSTTRVGKGIAYVQFVDENAVEAALLYNEKKFPPMLPRKLRVSRARAQKKNATPASGRPSAKLSGNGYQPKVSSAEASQMGRTGKLLGRAAASKARTSGLKAKFNPQRSGPNAQMLGGGITKPEGFVFEGHRASSKSGKSGLRLGGKARKKGKPTTRSAKRGAAYKAGNPKAK